jgi:sialic acid synthase SpsE
MRQIQLGDRTIGGEQPCFIIAEAGINHNGDVAIARRLIDEAKKAGADAVKFQKRTIDKILTRHALDQPYVSPNALGATYGEHREALELGRKEWQEIARHSDEAGILWFASPWDEDSVDFLDDLRVPLYKTASADLTNLPLLRYVAGKGKPVIMSTGMSTMDEIDDAVATVLEINPQLMVLHCVSAYPFDPELANLSMIRVLMERYPEVVVGYSGHEKSGLVISLAAVAMGAKVIERHFTLDRHMQGSDHLASLEPGGLSELVENIRKLDAAVGDGVKRIHDSEIPVREKLAKSVTAGAAITKGTVIDRADLVMRGPGTGLSGRHIDALAGRVAQRDLAVDDQLPADAVDWPLAASA